MNRNVAVGALLVAALVLLPTGALAASGGDAVAPQTANNSTNASSVAPGQMFSGVVDVQRAEVEGDVEARTFGLQVARSASDNATAEVVATRLQRVEQRLERLQERKRTLEQARENGSMSEGEYRARVAGVAARTTTAKAMLNQTANVSESLPTDVLAANGVNATAIQTLKERASELGGPEVAAIARSIAGPDVGKSARPEAAGPPGDRGNATAGAGTPGQAGGPDQPGSDQGPPTDRGGDGQPDSAGNVTDDTTTDGSDRRVNASAGGQ